MAVNKKQMKWSYFRILKFMLIGIIPNLLLYYFLNGILQEWLLTILSLLIFIAVGFIGEAIYVKIKNKHMLQSEIEKEQNKIARKRERENNK